MNGSTSPRTLPDFEDPPIVETVLGVQFAPLQGWGIPHFGLYWNEVKDEYSNFQVQPPLPVDFGVSIGLEMAPRAAPLLQVTAGAPVRCWFFNQARTRLIQVQNDRFMHNWIKTAEAQPYMHYEDVRPIFHREWQRFIAFLDRQHIEKPAMVQCEVTYVNHLDRGKGWSAFGELPSVIAPWSGVGSTGFLPPADAVVLNVRYPISEQASLSVIVEPAIRHSDGKQIIQMRLTATLLSRSIDVEDVCRSLDLGRSWVVSGFADLTTEHMHEVWKRRI